MICSGKHGYAQNHSFVYEEIIKVPGITNDSLIYNLTPVQKQTTRYYVDGLGRPVQTIAVKGSPSQHDIVQPIVYNNKGSQTTSYLPYVTATGDGNYRPSFMAEQSAFYVNGSGDKVAGDNSPFKQIVFENSPLNRVLQTGSVGDGFQPGQHVKTVAYASNTANDAVINWSPVGINQGAYAVNSLSSVLTTDEQGNRLVSFTDPEGKLILKRRLINEVINGTTETTLDTYYIYNEAGLISYIIPPKAVAFMRDNSNWDLTQTSVSKLLFSYVYDNRGRVVEKTVPGSSVVYIVYDPLNRPVLQQDGNLRATNQWNYIKYDVKGRIASQGMYTDASHVGRATMQNYVNTLDYAVNYYESRSSAAASGYYTNNVFPLSSIQDLAYAYYDDYDMDGNGVADYTYNVQGMTNEASATTLTRGKLTMIRKRGVGTALSNTWLISVQFYDKQSNVIQVLSNNQLNTAVKDSKTIVPDFTGKTMETKVVKYSASSATTVLSDYTYDHSNRVTAIDQQYNGAPSIRIASYGYNEIGQVIKKNLQLLSSASIPATVSLDGTKSVAAGGQLVVIATDSVDLNPGFEVAEGGAFSASITTNYLQSVDYRYNIRGALLSINNSTLTVGANNGDSNDVFGMEILYDQTDANLGNTAYYNGMTSAVKWMAKTPVLNQRSYKFDYDDQSRLKNANYAERTPSSTTWTNVSGFDEKNITYDHNGNIMTLQRNAVIGNVVSPVDDLNYTYDGNRLTNVTDGSGGNYGLVGFMNQTGSTDGYTYNDNGSLTADPKKGLTIGYNTLGKTDQITITTSKGRYINYNYDAGGNLLRKQLFDNNVAGKVTDYIDGFVYENGVLAYFGMPEGRVRNTGSALKPEYMITDHQGNVRVSFEEQDGQAVVRQENSYYPFGLIMPNSNIATPTSANTKLYNAGSEWQNDFSNLPDYYNTYYRNYDAATGRFIGVDPRADESESISPYHYASNNPVNFNDPLGDISAARIKSFFATLGQSGGYLSDYVSESFSSDKAAFEYGASVMNEFGGGFGAYGFAMNYALAAVAFNQGPHDGGNVSANMTYLPGVSVVAGNAESYLDAHNKIQDQMDAYFDGKDNVSHGVNWVSNNEGTISNYAAGWGYAVGAVGNQIGKIIKANSLYGAPLETSFVKTFAGNIEVSTSALRTTGTVLRVAGNIAGVAGLAITYDQYRRGKISGTEASVDAAFGAIGFLGPWGAAISIGYFGGKYLYENYTGKTLFDKPTTQ